MIVSIHQPNFIPWYPFFEKMSLCDRFVLLTKCQFEKNGYTNRFSRENQWYTMPVYRGLEPIDTKKYIDCEKNWNKIKTKLKKFDPVLSQFDQYICDSMSQTNSGIIEHIAKIINPAVQIVYDYDTTLKSTERLVDICKYYGATTYLAGQGGKQYMNMDLWKNTGIDVKFHKNKNTCHVLDFLMEKK